MRRRDFLATAAGLAALPNVGNTQEKAPMNSAFDILRFGAVPDGKTVCTKAIQDAIDACHQAGGGQVVCGTGTFVTGSLQLKDRVELHLSVGCRLLGSPRLEDYTRLVAKGFRDELGPEKSAHGLIWAAYAEDIAVTGPGTIDGGGFAFYDTANAVGKFDKPSTPRPRIGMFYQCRKLRLQDATLVDSPCWTLWLMQCENVQIQRLTITGNRRMRNVDGIDIDACRNVTVSDCQIETEDDCLILRSIQRLYETPAVCENVVVSNCVLDSGCQGVRVGCPGDGVIRNCTFANLVIRSANNGILCEHPHRYLAAGTAGTAHITNILFSQVVVDCQRNPIKVVVEEGIALPRLAGLSFADFRIRSGAPCVIQGCKETIIRDVSFANVCLETTGEDAILCRHCQNVHLNNVTLANRAEG
ncbi:MAG: glycosyl hydrolase family 28 protein [Lentisphaeria bacterium]|jgi:polygalacturonase|nr:glycosyl hydrolase family 28 protein [Lentisphaeria bacterium]